jgi:hypothetical protein
MAQMKSLFQRVEDQRGGRSGFPTDPAVLGRALGVYGSGESFPESSTPSLHLEEESERPHVLRSGKPTKPQLTPLLTIVLSRLVKFKSIAAEKRQEEFQRTINEIVGPLKAADELLNSAEQERFARIEAQWAELQTEGRILKRKTIPKLKEAEIVALNDFGNGQQHKERCVQHSQACEREMWRVRKDDFATNKEITAAEKEFADARTAYQEASNTALVRRTKLDSAQVDYLNAKSRFHDIQVEMDRLTAEASGEEYFDTTLGLAVNPVSHRDMQ